MIFRKSAVAWGAILLGVSLLAPARPAGAQEAPPAPLFEDWTDRAGLKGEDGSGGVAFADLDNDGFPDVMVGVWKIFLNEGGRALKRLPAQEGFAPPDGADPPVSPQGAALADVNGDGNLDAFLFFLLDVSNKDFKDHGRRNELWMGNGKGRFVLKKDTGISTDPATTATACFLDVDGDGRLDLFVGNWFVKPWQTPDAMVSPLYRQRADGTFEDVTEKAGIRGEAAPGTRSSRRPVFCATHTDWNNDGLQDLFVGTYAGGWNLLWRNNGDWTFTDVGAETGYDGFTDGRGFVLHGNDNAPGLFNVCLFSCPFADFDGDGDMDCFQATIRHWDNRLLDPSMLLVNLGAAGGWAFRREPRRIPRPPVKFQESNWGDLHAAWMDVDNDGFEDLAVASSDYPDEQLLRLYRQAPDGSGAFEEWTGRLGFRWVSASNLSLADFDRDGATDVLLSRNHMRLTPEQQKAYPLVTGLFRNLEPARAGNGFFTLRLRGQAVGARVVVTAGGRRQMREVQSTIGIGGQRNDADCRFGIGKAAVVDRVEVRWPDRPNTVQVFEKVARNRFYTLAKGGTLEEAPGAGKK